MSRYSIPYHEPWMDVPDYPDPLDYKSQVALDVCFDFIAIVYPDGTWESTDPLRCYADNPDRSDGEWIDDETEAMIDNRDNVADLVDEFISPAIDCPPGRYRLQGEVVLYYNLTVPYYEPSHPEYGEPNDYLPDSAESEFDTQSSKLADIKIIPLGESEIIDSATDTSSELDDTVNQIKGELEARIFKVLTSSRWNISPEIAKYMYEIDVEYTNRDEVVLEVRIDSDEFNLVASLINQMDRVVQYWDSESNFEATAHSTLTAYLSIPAIEKMIR